MNAGTNSYVAPLQSCIQKLQVMRLKKKKKHKYWTLKKLIMIISMK